MNGNVNLLQDLLNDMPVDVLLLKSKTIKNWLGTLNGSGCSIIVSRKYQGLLVDQRYFAEAKEKEHDLTIELLASQSEEAIYVKLYELSEKYNWKCLGVESESTLASTYLKLSEQFKSVVLLDKELTLLRAIKTSEEIKKIRKAVNITDEIFKEVSSQIEEGMTEYEISALVQYKSICRGAQKMSFDTICGIGERTAYPHCRPTSRALKRGEHVMIDFGIQIDNYQSDMTRICFLGKPNTKILEIYNIVQSAQNAGISSIKAGVDSEEVDRRARSVILRARYGEYFGHGLGHGIGIDNSTELPLLRPGKHFILKEGMVMSCEPGIYIPGVGGVRIENDVAVINGVGVSLNKTTTDPIILGV